MEATLHQHPTSEIRECFDCGGVAVRRSMVTQEFEYASRTGVVLLEARVPVWTCSVCGEATTDWEAEDLRHEVVCRHLGVLTPGQIRELRERNDLTQAGLAELTGFGEASIKRWESGALIQNEAADRLLRITDCRDGRLVLERIVRDKVG